MGFSTPATDYYGFFCRLIRGLGWPIEKRFFSHQTRDKSFNLRYIPLLQQRGFNDA